MSKKRSLVLGLSFILAVYIVSPGIAQEAQQMDPEMMEAYMKMMATNENHEFLKNFEGEWEVTTTAWMQPGAEPVITQNSAKAKLIFGGRFLMVNFEGSMFGQPFEGIQLIGYDNYLKKYVSLWIDSTSTGFYLTQGTREAGKKKIIETGLWPDPMSGTDMKVRTETTLVSENEYVFKMIMILPDGTEFQSMENRSNRKK